MIPFHDDPIFTEVIAFSNSFRLLTNLVSAHCSADSSAQMHTQTWERRVEFHLAALALLNLVYTYLLESPKTCGEQCIFMHIYMDIMVQRDLVNKG